MEPTDRVEAEPVLALLEVGLAAAALHVGQDDLRAVRIDVFSVIVSIVTATL